MTNLKESVLKKILAILLSIVVIFGSFYIMLPMNTNNTEENLNSVIEENYTEDNYISNTVFFENNNLQITSRGGQRLYKNEFVLSINNEQCLYYSNYEEALENEQYLLSNTENLDVYIESMKAPLNFEDSTRSEINDTIYKYLIEYPKTCYPTTTKYISSPYGYRHGEFHSGIDLAGHYGDDIYAYMSGTVIYVQYSNVSYGNMILIEHPNGWKTRYAHLSKINVDNGDYVECGQIIGYEGSTGRSTGTHLHFEIIINNKTVNPYGYLFK